MPSPRIPLLSLVLGFGPALVGLALAAGAWLASAPADRWLLAGGTVWAFAILFFLSGVRRGLSFFTPDGPRPVQVATSLWLFALALAGVVLPTPLALAALALGFLSVGLLDPLAARRGEVPAHFARLRPPQMAIFVLAVLALLARALHPAIG